MLHSKISNSFVPGLTYRNPVYSEYFADPFVLKASSGRYYAYGTGPINGDGRAFPVLVSDDLVSWTALGGALEPLTNPAGVHYWAPEVAEHEGRFYLYYSATTSRSDEHHRLRVAVSDTPEGPFRDSGKLLMPDSGFTIDAHPFRDPESGQWYLFYATDFVDDAPHGTGLAAVKLSKDMLSVDGNPRCVVRASADWQIYERNRDYKGQTWPAWHCIEGPFVLHHGGKYYCLYSGGAWKTENYGVGFAVADHPLGPWTDTRASEGPAVLRGVADRVIGPGHNSVVVGPDNRTQFIVYHAWDKDHSARRMCIDPLHWTPSGPRCDGPSFDSRTIKPLLAVS